MVSNRSARPGFSLHARCRVRARRHVHALDRLKPGLALRLLNKALFYISTI